MNGVETKMSKYQDGEKEIYINLHIVDPYMVNLTFFEKTDKGFTQRFPHEVSAVDKKRWVGAVSKNEVTPLTDAEQIVFEKSYNMYLSGLLTYFKESGELPTGVTVEKVVTFLGYLFVIIQQPKAKQIFQVTPAKEGFELSHFPVEWTELFMAEYMTDVRAKNKPQYFMLSDEWIIGVTKRDNDAYVYIVLIHIKGGLMVSERAFALEKLSNRKYQPLSIEKASEKRLEILKREAENIIDNFNK